MRTFIFASSHRGEYEKIYGDSRTVGVVDKQLVS